MIAFGVLEIIFSQIPDFDQIWWLSIVAAVMSFTYSSIGLTLGIVQTIGKPCLLTKYFYHLKIFFLHCPHPDFSVLLCSILKQRIKVSKAVSRGSASVPSPKLKKSGIASKPWETLPSPTPSPSSSLKSR